MNAYQLWSFNFAFWLLSLSVLSGCGDKNIFLKNQIESDQVNVSSAESSEAESQVKVEDSAAVDQNSDSTSGDTQSAQNQAGQNKDDKETVNTPEPEEVIDIPELSLFLKEDDLKVPSGEMRTVFEGEMDQFLRFHEHLKNPFEASGSGKDIFESELCPDKLWKTLIFKVYGPGQILVDQQVDFDCDPGPVDSSGLDLKRTVNIKGRYYLWATCEGTDLSSHHEKPMTGINPLKKGLYFNLCPDSSEMKIALQYKFIVNHKFSYTAFTQDAYRNSIETAFSYSFSKDGSFCSVGISKGSYSVDQCDEVYWEQDLNFTSYKNDVLDKQSSQVTSAYQKNVMNQLSYELIGARFQSGSIKFMHNNWEGDMTYNGGGKYRYESKSSQGPVLSGGND